MPHFTPSSAEPSNGLTVRIKAKEAADEAKERQRIRVKNRRLAYLEQHPEYFDGSNLELADPLLYDRLVRRFQTPAEREKEGRERGYAGNLEAHLVRSEAKLAAVRDQESSSSVTCWRAGDGRIVEVDRDDGVGTREEGMERWRDVMGQRFLRGEDGGFEYGAVDENDEYDDREEENRKQLEQYLDGQDAEYVGDGTPKGETGVQDF